MKTSFKNVLSIFAILLACASCDTNKPSESVVPSTPSTSGQVSESVQPSTPSENELTFDTTKNVSITFYHTMNQYLKEIVDYYIGEFCKEYPNIEVTSVSAGDYDGVEDQLVTSISAGKVVCDMAYCYPDHVALYNRAKALLVLDKYMEHPEYGFTNEQIEDFIPAYYNEGKSFGDGLMYCLPFSKSTEVMYYDINFFEQEGLSVPDHWFAKTDNLEDDKTSMEYVCDYIEKKYPADIPLGYDSSSNLFITLCEQLGSGYTSATGEHYIFNNETNRGFVTELKEWYDKGYLTTKAIYGQYTSNLFKNQDKSTSRCYMSIGSSAGASNQVPDGYTFEVGVAKLPQEDAVNNPKVISQGPSVCILDTKDPQKNMACWLLLRYLTTSVNFQAEFSMQSGYAPVINSVYNNEIYLEFLDNANGSTFLTARANEVALSQADWYYTSPAFVGSSQARDAVGALLDSALIGTVTVEEAFEKAINELKSI